MSDEPPKVINPKDFAQVSAALQDTPRLLAFLRAIHDDVSATIGQALLRYDPRLAVLASYRSAHANVAKAAPWAAQHPEYACGAGCWWCCTKPVQVTAPEVLIIADKMLTEWPADQVAAVIDRAKAYVKRTGGKNIDKWPAMRLACPLLDEQGRCSVYEDRPLICRGWNSTSAEQCEKAYNSRWTLDGGPMIFSQMSMIQAVISELRGQAGEVIGPIEHVILAPALLIALTTEDALLRWIGGEDIFAAAKWPKQK